MLGVMQSRCIARFAVPRTVINMQEQRVCVRVITNRFADMVDLLLNWNINREGTSVMQRTVKSCRLLVVTVPGTINKSGDTGV